MQCETVYELDLGSIEKIKTFEQKIAGSNACLRLEQNGRVIDAKDIIGLFMLDLRQPIKLHVTAA